MQDRSDSKSVALRTIMETAVEDRLIRANPCQIKGAAAERSPERPTLTVSEVYAPVTGEVIARNDSLDATPELVNSDPYGSGWLFEVVPSNGSDVDGLMDAATYQSSLAN